jgi:hypothetical protein
MFVVGGGRQKLVTLVTEGPGNSKSRNGGSSPESVFLGVEPTLGLVTGYYFLSEGFCLKVALFSLWAPSLVAQLYPQALGSIYVTSYNSEGYGGDILTLFHTGSIPARAMLSLYSLRKDDEAENTTSDNCCVFFTMQCHNPVGNNRNLLQHC